MADEDRVRTVAIFEDVYVPYLQHAVIRSRILEENLLGPGPQGYEAIHVDSELWQPRLLELGALSARRHGAQRSLI